MNLLSLILLSRKSLLLIESKLKIICFLDCVQYGNTVYRLELGDCQNFDDRGILG